MKCMYPLLLQFYSPPISRYTTHSLSHVSVGSIIFLVDLSFNQDNNNPFPSFYTVPKLVGIYYMGAIVLRFLD